MDFESILEEVLLDRGQGNLKLKPKKKEALQAIVFERSILFNCRSNCRITETSAEGRDKSLRHVVGTSRRNKSPCVTRLIS